MAGRLEGRVALVTGASRGIGRATAMMFAREGAAVVVNYARAAEAAESAVAEIRGFGGRAIAVPADVAQREQVDRMVAATLEAFGAVDILVNNAGIIHQGSLLELREPELDAMIAVNVKGLVHATAAAVPHMVKRRWGRIVNIASLAALGTAVQGTTGYAATNAAVLILTKRSALELGRHGITVNAICPGFIRTDMLASIGEEDDGRRLAALAEKTMLGRVGSPADVANAALFLASEEAAFVTAQALTVDGGRMDFLTHSA
jgi:3-oxoacyl-[acyl-carrier protein] reductase